MKKIVTLLASQLEPFIKDDIVRPGMTAAERTQPGRKTFALQEDDDVKAIICVAYGHSLPTNETELREMGFEYRQGDFFIVPYTMWSYSPGAGGDLIFALLELIKTEYGELSSGYSPRVATMSPKTRVASRFHLKNGAKLLAENEESYNFEYKI
jgi:hypothetical protein